MTDAAYAKTPLNTVNRYRNRGKYDYKTVYPIINETPILHVSFEPAAGGQDPTFPVILPMLGCTGRFPKPDANDDDGIRSVYLHGYVSSRFLRLAKDNDQATGETENGIPVCVAATQLDGIVLALTPNHHSCNYRSAVVFGNASVVVEEAERLYAMELITNNLVPERWHNTRFPNSTELKSTGILRVDIYSASAKIRTGTTGEDRNDLKNEEMREKVWAGVVPAYQQWGEPVPAPTNMVKEIPNYIEDWVTGTNAKRKDYCRGAAN